MPAGKRAGGDDASAALGAGAVPGAIHARFGKVEAEFKAGKPLPVGTLGRKQR